MTDWKNIWEYQVPLHHVLPASGEQRAIRSGYLIQHTINGHSRLTELAPLGFSWHHQAGMPRSTYGLHASPAEVERRLCHATCHYRSVRAALHTSKTIFTNPLIDLRQISESILEPKADCVKVKMGRRPLDIEIRDLLTLLQRLPSTTQLRIDANRQWGVDEALACARCVPAHQLLHILKNH